MIRFHMHSYNCFFLGDDGKISEVAFAECADDADALHWAEGMLLRNPEFQQAELWQSNRLVCPRGPLIKDSFANQLVSDAE